jgi:hypothetical protein
MSEENQKDKFWRIRDNKAKGYQRLVNYFEKIRRKESFLEEVCRVRKNYDIPKNGYNWHKEGVAPFSIPNNWPYINDKVVQKKLDKEIEKLCLKHGLNDHYWNAVIHEYILWNDIIGLLVYSWVFDLCYIDDPEISKSLSPDDKRKANKMYPVKLKISQYASNREIIAFVKSNSKEIRCVQKKYIDEKIEKSLKVRKRNELIRKRNDFIYKHRNKPYKEISSLVSDNFPLELTKTIDEGSVGKIISIEKKRRN